MPASPLQTGPNLAVSNGLISRRRKVRKGTFSCWECKRRKTRCEFKPTSGPVCNLCQRLGLPCISQEFDELVQNDCDELEKRVNHVEALASELARQRDSGIAQSSGGDRISNASILRRLGATWEQSPSRLLASGSSSGSEYQSLNAYLHTVLPPPAVIALIIARGKLPLEMLRQPGSTSEASEVVRHPALPVSTTHPILFARRLFQLAICLQNLDTIHTEQLDMGLDEPLCKAASRYVDVARHVTSQDLLVTSLEGLETLMLEGCYLINTGRFPSAWHVFRRALKIAQRMGLPQHAESIGGRVEFLWFRFIYCDRFLSLLMGRQLAVRDNKFASESCMARDTPLGKLERIHVMVSGRIIARNLHIHSNQCGHSGTGDEHNDYQETYTIDFELKRAARYLPPRWWMHPTIYELTEGTNAADNTARLVAQMHQHYLLVLTHQPYLLRELQYHRTPPPETPNFVDCAYNKVAVLSASREVISSVLLFRKIHPTPAYYPGIDHKAITASMTLLLAHLDGHRLGCRANVLEHQRPHDLGMVGNVIDALNGLSSSQRDAPTRKGVEELKNLLNIESDAAYGTNYLVLKKDDASLETQRSRLDIWIPYFGTICIIRHSRYGNTMASSHLSLGDVSKPVSRAPQVESSATPRDNLTTKQLPHDGDDDFRPQLQRTITTHIEPHGPNESFQNSSRISEAVDLSSPVAPVQRSPPTDQPGDIQYNINCEINNTPFGTWIHEEEEINGLLGGDL